MTDDGVRLGPFSSPCTATRPCCATGTHRPGTNVRRPSGSPREARATCARARGART